MSIAQLNNNYMLQSWLLDLVVIDGTLDHSFTEIDSGIWLIISADGIPRPFSTTECTNLNNPSWNFPARMILQFCDVHRAYLYVTLCTRKPHSESVQCIGRSKIGLRNLPIGSPKTFTFPLMFTRNATQVAMTVRITATLSNLNQSNEMRNN